MVAAPAATCPPWGLADTFPIPQERVVKLTTSGQTTILRRKRQSDSRAPSAGDAEWVEAEFFMIESQSVTRSAQVVDHKVNDPFSAGILWSFPPCSTRLVYARASCFMRNSSLKAHAVYGIVYFSQHLSYTICIIYRT